MLLSYAGSMDTIILPDPMPGRLLALIAPDAALGPLFEMVARLALRGPLYVLDGGNTFQGYPLARALRRMNVDAAGPLSRVMLSRAFTCYQMAALLEETDFAVQPVLVLDFLSTFYDQGVRIADRSRLLRICIRRLQVLSRGMAVAAWIRQRSVVPEEALSFIEQVQHSAGLVWRPPRRPALPVMRQESLF